MSRINVLGFEVGATPLEVEMENDLESMQELVEGYIEVVGITEDIVMVINEEGKIDDLPENFSMSKNRNLLDVIKGNAFFVANGDDGDFKSLSKEQINNIKSAFHEIQSILEIDKIK